MNHGNCVASRPISSIRLSVFFLKTVFFNPSNNPNLVLFFVFIFTTIIQEVLNEHLLVFALWLFPFGHFFMSNVFSDRQDGMDHSAETPVNRYFRALPIPGNRLCRSYLIASMVYILFVLILPCYLLIHYTATPPDMKVVAIENVMDGNGDSLLMMHARSHTNQSRHLQGLWYTGKGLHSMLLEKSILFDPILRHSTGPLWVAVLYVLSFVSICIGQAYTQFKKHAGFKLGLLWVVPLACHLLLGLPVLLELILPQSRINSMANIADAHFGWFLILCAAACAAILCAAAMMSHRILRHMRRI